jgi:hypothetical protein
MPFVSATGEETAQFVLTFLINKGGEAAAAASGVSGAGVVSGVISAAVGLSPEPDRHRREYDHLLVLRAREDIYRQLPQGENPHPGDGEEDPEQLGRTGGDHQGS